LTRPVETIAPPLHGTRETDAIDSLTGLRFIAAFSVLVAHASNGLMAFEVPSPLVQYFAQGPAIGMPLFFVLSGFVIHYNYAKNFRYAFVGPTLDFFIARFARLYPLYLFLLIIYLANQRIVPGAISGEYDLSHLLRYLLLWQAWSIEYRGTTWFGHLLLPPAWSISVEVFFYALYPLLALSLLKLKTVARISFVLFPLVLVYYVVIVLCFSYFDELRVWGNQAFQINADPQNALLGWFLNTGPVGRIWEFLMGALVAQAYLVLRSRPAGAYENQIGTFVLYGSIIAVAVIYDAMRYNRFFGFFGSYPGGLSALFALIMFCCARYKNSLISALGSSALVKLGDASYSIYLIHFFTLQLFHLHGVFPVTGQNLIVWTCMMSIAIIFTLVVSLGTYRVIEAPSRIYLRRVLHQLKDAAGVSKIAEAGPLRGATSAALIVGLLTCFVFWNRPKQNFIDIVDATYGQNCSSFAPPSPAVNLFRPGNATDAVRQDCAGVRSCDFAINVNRLGDPASGCAKDFSAIYRCPGDGDGKIVRASPEAHGKTIKLSCP
jgi:peptidoglycan/LPS O-acetylase OafA/YrhL